MNGYIEQAKLNGYTREELNEKDRAFIEGMEHVVNNVLGEALFGDDDCGADEWSPTVDKIMRKIRDNVVKIIKDCIESEITDVMISMLDNEENKINENKELPEVSEFVYGVLTPCGGCPDYDENNSCEKCSKAFVSKFAYEEDVKNEWGKRVFWTESEANELCEKMKRLN